MKRNVGVLLLTLMLITSALSSISFADEKFEITMYVGERIDLDSFLIENQVLSAEEDMSWSTGNDRIVDVNSSGTVEANEEGKATIYAKDKKNSSRVATIKIKVISMVEDFQLIDEEISIRIGEVYNLEYEITPVDGQDTVYDDDIEWTSSNPHYVEVDDNGQIVGVKEGTTKVHAKTVDGNKKDYVVVNVSGLKEDITIDDGAEEVDIYVGGSHQFKATADGKEVTQGVEWSSAITDRLTIDEDGYAEGVEEGTTQIKASTKDKKKFDTVMVNVISMVEGIKLSHRKVSLSAIGDTVDLDYSLVPAIEGLEPYEDDVEWSSSNSNIASVDDNGVVTAKDRGVARITGKTVDGEHEDYCSVTVLEDADVRETIVEKITLDHPVETLFVGQEYKLPIIIEPANATENKLKFETKIGSSSQIDEENRDDDVDDGEGVLSDYYFTPTEAGKNEITITTESEEEVVYEVEVISPIKGVNIDTKNLQEDKGKYYFYVGQKMLLEPIFELRKDYTDDDIYERGVDWDIEDDDLLDIDREARTKENEDDETEYDYYLVGLEKGTTTLTVTSDDGEHKEDIEIKVLSSYDKLELVDDVTLPINTELVPEIKKFMKSDLKYELVPDENFELEKEMSIYKQYVRIDTINEEIALEKNVILDLQKSAIDSENSAVIYAEINEHRSRLSKLELVKETVKDGFCEIRESVELEDVFGEDYIVADLEDGVITGKRDGKIELKVTFPGTKVETIGTYYFSSDLKGIIIVNESGDIVSVNESGFSHAFTDAALAEEIKLAKLVEDRFGSRSSEDTPSNKYARAILNLEELGIVPDTLKKDYRENVTRLELAETFVNLMEYIADDTLKRPKSYFNDTTSSLAALAYNLGIVDVSLPLEFEPYEKVTPVTFAKAVDRMQGALKAYGYNDDKLVLENDLGTGQKLFTDIDQVSISHRQYIDKYAVEYGIIEANNNKLNPEKGLTKEVFLYYVSKLIF